jgi:hypothetical protein
VLQREPIAAALWRIASQSSEYATANRRLRHWANVSPPEMPALFMTEKGAQADGGRQPGLPVIYKLMFDFYIYVHSSDPYLAPATLLNPLIDALEAALSPFPANGMWQNLGFPASVNHTYINGRIETDEGVLGDIAIATVPVEILAV